MRAAVFAMTAIAMAGLACGGAYAQQWRPDPKAPIDMTAKNEGAYSQKNCTLKMRGDVKVIQGRARLLGQSMTATSPKRGDGCGDVNRIEVDRDVYYVTPDASVRADHAVYDLDASTVVFSGEVIVLQGKNVSVSKGLLINLDTNETAMTGPVRAVVYPEEKGPAAK